MNFQLKKVLPALLLVFLMTLLAFMGLSTWRFLKAFTRFVEVDQRTSLTLGRQYEQLINRWSELDLLHTEALLEIHPLDQTIKEATLKNITDIKISLDQASRGTSHEKQWLTTKRILTDYTQSLQNFDGLLASWCAKITAQNQDDFLVEMKKPIHVVSRSLRQLRSSGIKKCLEESDRIWEKFEQDSHDHFVKIWDKFYFRFLFLAFAIMLVALGLLQVPSAIVTPLGQLQERFSMVSSGQKVPLISPTRIQEIDELESSFQAMVRYINESTSIQTQYFETLTLIPGTFSSLYQKDASCEYLFCPQEQAMAKLFPLLSNQMRNLVAGQIAWNSEGNWLPCGPIRFTPFLESISNSEIEPSPNSILERLCSDCNFFAWAWERVVAEAIVVKPEEEIASSKLNLLFWPEIPPALRGESEFSFAFLGIRLSPSWKSEESSTNPGFLLLAFHQTEQCNLSRADLIFISLIAQQMVALIETARLLTVFRQNQAIAVQLKMAKEIQENALPRELPRNPFFDCQASIKMCNEVGGDFYDFLSLPDNKLGVLIADVSGKNVSAALLTMALKAALHSLPFETMTPKALVDRLNQVLLNIVGAEHFVTLSYVILDPVKSELTLCNAGHVSLLLFAKLAEGDYTWQDFQPANFPLGLFPHSFAQQTIPFAPGDRLILYTDGVTDCQNAMGLRFGETSFRALLEQKARSPLEDILAAIDEFRGSVALPDDATTLSVSFRCQPSA